jgi:phosphoenolpyruvate phosphomutase
VHQATKLRALLKKPAALKIVGAHGALSPKLIERAGFDGI